MIHYLKGDATKPVGPGNKLIIHVANNAGAWGAGFVLALSKKWKEPERRYMAQAPHGLLLGTTQIVQVEPDIWVANMVAQTLNYRQGPNIKYGALEECLRAVELEAATLGATIHGPRFGAGLAGGRWSIIEELLETTLPNNDIYIYDYEGPGAIQWR